MKPIDITKDMQQLINQSSKLSIYFLIFLLCQGFYAKAQQNIKYYGEKISAKGAVPSRKIVKLLKKEGTVETKVKGTILACCQKKGCWLMMDIGNGQKMRVKFKEYGFFVPKDSQGDKVVIEGIAQKEIIDVATLQHYAEDAGKSKEEIEAITQPRENYTFVAKGVIITEN